MHYYYFSLISIVPSLVYGVIIETSYGKLEGKDVPGDDYGMFHSFKSVPFVKAPLGDLRFELPQKMEPWEGIKDAREYSPACPSISKEFHGVPQNQSEDCLYLNIFTSQKCLDTSNCSVIMFTHGGGMNLDSAIMFPEDFFFEKYVKNDIVFVTTAYRLGVLGLYSLGDEELTHQNLDFYDCNASLHYIYQEVKHFGGNEKHITLMGHSSGAVISLLLGVSKNVDPDRKIIERIIFLSGIPQYNVPQLYKRNINEMNKRSGCGNSTKVHDILRCMRSKPYEMLLDIQIEMDHEHMLFWNYILGPPFANPGVTVAEFLEDIIPREILFGCTKNEMGPNPYPDVDPSVAGGFWSYENPIEIGDYFTKLQADSNYTINEARAQGIFMTTILYSQAFARKGGKVYIFQSEQEPHNNHVSDMQYFVGYHREKVHTPDMDILNTFYSKMLVNFTKFGNPSPNWEPLNLAKMNYYSVQVDTKNNLWPVMKNNFHQEEYDFWMKNMTKLDKLISAKKSTGKLQSFSGISDVSSRNTSFLFMTGIGLMFSVFFVLLIVKQSERKRGYIVLQ